MKTRTGPFTYLLASAILAASALLALYAAWRIAPTSPQAVYTLTPLPGSGGRVRVELELSHLPPGRFVLLAPESGASEGEGNTVVPDFGDHAGEQMAARLWWGVPKGGKLRVVYEVVPQSGDDRHALLYGARTFAVPLGADARAALFDRAVPPGERVPGAARHLEVRFQLPAAWDAYTPWEESAPWKGVAPRIVIDGGRFARLREAVVALGDYVPRERRVASATVWLVTRGTDLAREDRLTDLVVRCLRAHAEVMGALPHRRVLVVTDHPFHGDQAVGQTMGNAIHLSLSRDVDAFEKRSLPRVVAHEMFHLWNGGAVDLDDPELRWFAEGVTDYYSLRSLSQIGLLSRQDLAQELAAYMDRLHGNSWADSSFGALGRGYADNPLAWSATYSKGALSAWALDLRLKANGGLDPLVSRIARAGGRPDLRAEIVAVDARAIDLVDSLSGPSFYAALQGELARHHLRLSREPSRLLTLGLRFFRPGTTEVADLDPDGPAARDGIHRGDRVVAVNGTEVGDLALLSQAMLDSPDGAVRLRVERGRHTFDVHVTPQRATVTRLIEAPRDAMSASIPAPGELPASARP